MESEPKSFRRLKNFFWFDINVFVAHILLHAAKTTVRIQTSSVHQLPPCFCRPTIQTSSLLMIQGSRIRTKLISTLNQGYWGSGSGFKSSLSFSLHGVQFCRRKNFNFWRLWLELKRSLKLQFRNFNFEPCEDVSWTSMENVEKRKQPHRNFLSALCWTSFQHVFL